jgi:predicted nucleotidyltransferase component of viral defense system
VIVRAEIEDSAKEFGLYPADVERDYIFGWLLAGIYGQSQLRHKLVLKGGNCFRKAYFEHTRFSRDLDFSSNQPVDADNLHDELNSVCDFVSARTGVVFENDRNRVKEKGNSDQERRIYEARLYFKDFYGNPHSTTISVHLDVTELDRILLPVEERSLIHPYSDAGDCAAVIRCHKLEELLAAKLKCLLQRRHALDLYDFVYSVFVNRDIAVDRSQVLQTFLQKTIFSRSPGVARGLLLDLPLEGFRAVWNKYLVCPLQSLVDIDTAIGRFKEIIESIFQGLVPNFHDSFAFFPSQHRNMIMQAGSELTLLQITYDYGGPRLVEPYSLIFQQRKDGIGQEYLYVYDRTGGRTGPGIKKFLHPKIRAMANTQEQFEPRAPVELSKAGEFFGKTYLGSGLRSSTGRRSRGRSSFERIYVVECPYCDKQFQRKRHNARLRPHKDKYGNNCFGRTGYFA